ncbi:MAG: hypothetical protein R3C01_08150 [Planctomycetaceae bacterium]
MMRTTAIYELNKITDDPRFEGFALAPSPSVLGRDSLDDDLTPGFAVAEEDPEWTQPKLVECWPTPTAEGRVSEFNDYPCVDMVLPAFSERAVKVLHDLLESNGETLPLATTTTTRFFLFNILTVTDALDQIGSRCEFWCDPPTTASDIEYFSFDAQKVQGLSIFRIREMPMSVFVTNHFVDLVESHQLQGFEFKKVWPIPPDVNWRMQEDDHREERRRLKRHTLVLVLPLRGTSDETSRIHLFENALDARLQVDSLQSNYLGSYEGRDFVADECRLFLSCPNVDCLLTNLQTDIEQLQWADPIRAYRRYGRLYEAEAQEEMTMI